jgi:hypothetical protein
MHGVRSDDVSQFAQDMHELILIEGGLATAFCDINTPMKDQFYEGQERGTGNDPDESCVDQAMR